MTHNQSYPKGVEEYLGDLRGFPNSCRTVAWGAEIRPNFGDSWPSWPCLGLGFGQASSLLFGNIGQIGPSLVNYWPEVPPNLARARVCRIRFEARLLLGQPRSSPGSPWVTSRDALRAFVRQSTGDRYCSCHHRRLQGSRQHKQCLQIRRVRQLSPTLYIDAIHFMTDPLGQSGRNATRDTPTIDRLLIVICSQLRLRSTLVVVPILCSARAPHVRFVRRSCVRCLAKFAALVQIWSYFRQSWPNLGPNCPNMPKFCPIRARCGNSGQILRKAGQISPDV